MDEKGLRDRVKSLEQQLKSAKACAAISKSKAERALANEKFILDSVKEAAEGLLCKKTSSPRAYVWLLAGEHRLKTPSPFELALEFFDTESSILRRRQYQQGFAS